MYSISLIALFSIFEILAWTNFRKALILFCGLFPIYLLRFSIGPLPTTALEVCILILAGVWIIRDRKIHIQISKSWKKIFSLIFAAAVLGIFVAPDSVSAFGIFRAYFLEPAIFGFLLLNTFKKNDWKKGFYALAISGLILSIIGIAQYFTGIGIPAPWDIERRITSIFPYPNALGLYLAPIISGIIIHRFLQKKKKIKTILLDFLLFTVCAIAIILAKTEAAFVAIPAASIFTILISQSKKSTKKFLTLGAAAFLIIAFLASSTIQSKLLLQDYSGQVRLSQWQETSLLLKDQPIFGAGLRGYPELFADYHDATLYEIFQYPHNIFLNIWVELGLLGLFGFFLLAINIFRSAWQKKNITVLIAFSALTTMFIHGLVDVSFFKNDLAMMTVFFLCVIIAFDKKTQQKTN